MNRPSNILSSILILFCCGCSNTYIPDTISQSTKKESAVIKTDSAGKSEVDKAIGRNALVTFSNLDSEDLIGFFTRSPEIIYMPPGEHNLKFKIFHGNAYANGCLSINAKAGHEYLLKNIEENRSVKFWIVDIGNDAIVSHSC
jgi:hypothetical protein